MGNYEILSDPALENGPTGISLSNQNKYNKTLKGTPEIKKMATMKLQILGDFRNGTDFLTHTQQNT